MKHPPKTLAQATTLLGHYAQVSAQAAEVEARREADVARINAAADQEAARLQKELGELSARLQPWWDANKADIARDKKSATISACTIGYRTTAPKLSHIYATDDVAVEALKGTRLLKQTTVTRVNLDKKAIVKLLGLDGKAAEQLAMMGFKVDQQDAFFIKSAEPASALAA